MPDYRLKIVNCDITIDFESRERLDKHYSKLVGKKRAKHPIMGDLVGMILELENDGETNFPGGRTSVIPKFHGNEQITTVEYEIPPMRKGERKKCIPKVGRKQILCLSHGMIGTHFYDTKSSDETPLIIHSEYCDYNNTIFFFFFPVYDPAYWYSQQLLIDGKQMLKTSKNTLNISNMLLLLAAASLVVSIIIAQF